MRYVPLYITCLICYVNMYAISEKVSVHYTVTPKIGLAGLKCLLVNVEFRRVTRLNTASGACEVLDQDWSVNATYEPGYAYMTMISYEVPFTQNFSAISTFPRSFDVGCHFDVILKTPDFNLTGFKINIKDSRKDTKLYFMHMYFTPTSNKTVFRSRNSGNWSEAIKTSNPITQQNTVYRATVYLYETHWSVFVNDDHLTNFSHDHVLCCKPKVTFSSHNVLCVRIIFYGP